MDKEFKYWVLGIAAGLIFISMFMFFNKNKYYVVTSNSHNLFAVVNTNNGDVKRYSFIN